VHDVKVPQPRPLVRQDVPHVERVVEQEHGEGHLQPDGQSQELEQPPPPSLDEGGERPHDGLFRNPERSRAHGGHGQVTRLAPELGLDGAPQRAASLQPREQPERADDERRADPCRNLSPLHNAYPMRNELNHYPVVSCLCVATRR
jgi:hypothetical protein